METGSNWRYAVEYTSADRSLAELLSAAHRFLQASRQDHEVALETPACVVVRFADLSSAERFYFDFKGRFVALPSDPLVI